MSKKNSEQSSAGGQRYRSHEVFKKNVRSRLEVLGVTPYKVSQAAGKGRNWLSDILLPDRYNEKIGSNIIDAVALALGNEPWSLIDPRFKPKVDPPPTWLRIV